MSLMVEEQNDYVLRLRGHHMVPSLENAIRTAHRLGVRIATGADTYYERGAINRISLEVEKLADLGLSNFEALQAATTSSAELLGVADRTGRIAPGFEADLILVSRQPARRRPRDPGRAAGHQQRCRRGQEDTVRDQRLGPCDATAAACPSRNVPSKIVRPESDRDRIAVIA